MTDDILLRLRADNSYSSEVSTLLFDAAYEIHKLRSLVSELLPYMLNDMEQGLYLAYVQNHEENAPCLDCQWFEDATLWKKRVDSGEFAKFNI